jgi:hypothetical protein
MGVVPYGGTEPGSRFVLYRNTTANSTGAPVAGARVEAVLSDPFVEGGAIPVSDSGSTAPEVVVAFGSPSTTDSLRVDLALIRE